MKESFAAAIKQIKKKEEAGLNDVYSKTYNYVYLRAKNILKKESEIQQLMQEVYLQLIASASELEEADLYEWLGKCVYRFGCTRFRKKKTREADVLEIEKSELDNRKTVDLEKTAEVIKERIEELPDLYQATFYAFYYDYMSVSVIAEVMDETEGTIINRLNYTRKYMLKALSDYQEEKNIKTAFSMDSVKTALRQWSMENCLGLTAAQFVYSEICKAAGLKASSIHLEGKEFAGVNNTVVYHKADDLGILLGEFEKYAPRAGVDKKQLGVFVGIAALVVAIIVGIALFVTADKGEKEDQQPGNQIEQNQDDPDQEPGNSEDLSQEEPEDDIQNQEDANQEEPNGDDSNNEEPKDDTNNPAAVSEYILPDSSTRELRWDEVEHLTKEQLRLARNEIFARHGMIFGVEDLAQYFSSKSWYSPTIPAEDFSSQIEMSLIEERNINLILSVEESK